MPTALEYPLREEVYGNIALTREKVPVAFYRIQDEAVMLLDLEAKEKTKKKNNRCFSRLQGNGSFEIRSVPVNADIRARIGELRKQLDKDNQEYGSQILKETCLFLEQDVGVVTEKIWIISVPLVKKGCEYFSSVSESAKNFISKKAENLAKGVGFEIEVDEKEIERMQKQEKEVFQNLSELRIERLTSDELYYYQAFQFLKGNPHLRKEIIAGKCLENLLSTPFKAKLGEPLIFYGDNGNESHSIYSIAVDFGIHVDKNHVLEIVQKMPFPVEQIVQVHFEEKNGVGGLRKAVDRARTRNKSIMKEANYAGSTQKRKIIEGARSLDDLGHKLDDDEPIVKWFLIFSIVGKNRDSVERRQKYLEHRLESVGVKIVSGKCDNYFLFENSLYGNFSRQRIKFGGHTTTLRALCELNFFTALKAGTRTGFYIGRVDSTLEEKTDVKSVVASSKNMVFLNLFLANQQGVKGKKTHNPHILFTGDTGNGKSVAGKGLFMYCALLESQVLYIDPKAEMRNRFMEVINDERMQKKNPSLVKFLKTFNYVTLDPHKIENQGVLDPIVLFEEREARAVSRAMLFSLYDGEWKLAPRTVLMKILDEVIQKRIEGEEVGLYHVLDGMLESEVEEVRDMGDFLKTLVKGSILELAFSYGGVKGLSFDEKVTILEIEGLCLPKEKHGKLDDNERLSTALMYSLGEFCSTFGSRDRLKPTVSFFDEAWILQSSSDGQGIIKSMKRVGRSYNNFLVLITQSVSDVEDHGDDTGFGMTFCFDELVNRESVLKYLDLPVNDLTMKWISGMPQGQCLFRDMTGQVNRIVFHVLFEDWLELFKTVEKSKAVELENDFIA
ncbi:conjugal transfer protein [Enterococcus faecium]|nr:ATP-binding protein [Enterococcus faecium]EME3581657.1 ATP-binding protein [Enterococcus faecium]EMF0114603.1 ATP-binding protein [Enterococcus hirae]MBL3708513.1 conjugal transfer protein [Enterococcus faecium]